MYETLWISVGRSSEFHGGWEFVLYSGDVIVKRDKYFRSHAQAKRAGLKMADTLLADPLPF